jgi:hypothetical protein
MLTLYNQPKETYSKSLLMLFKVQFKNKNSHNVAFEATTPT